MKIYLAARYSRMEELRGYAGELAAAGHVITSRWIRGGNGIPETAAVDMESQRFALEDYRDLSAADTVISWTEPPRVESTALGGRHVEFGLALAMGKRLLLVGPRENLFHTMPNVHQFDEWGPDVLNTLYESEWARAMRKRHGESPPLIELQVRTFWRN